MASYLYVPARFFTPGGRRTVYGVNVHMAQGGGTVPWLSRLDGKQGNNSSTLVIEYTGRPVQMVPWTAMDHSLHISYDSDGNDRDNCGIYGLNHVKAVLGSNWSTPLPYSLSIEFEGFEADGPNGKQIDTMTRIVMPDLKARFRTIRGLLGHADYQDYKDCPGCDIPWKLWGGHGKWGILPIPIPTPPQVKDMASHTNVQKVAETKFYVEPPVGGSVTLYGWKFDPTAGKYVRTSPASIIFKATDGNSWATYNAVHTIMQYPEAVPSGKFISVSSGAMKGWLVNTERVRLEKPIDPLERISRMKTKAARFNTDIQDD